MCCEGVREGICEGEWRGGVEVGCVRGERKWIHDKVEYGGVS